MRALHEIQTIGSGGEGKQAGETLRSASLYVMVHANLRGIPKANWDAQWWKTNPMVTSLGRHIVSQEVANQQVDIFATRTERSAATARKVAEILDREFKLALNVDELWDGGYVPQGQYLDIPERSRVLSSARNPETATILVGHHETIRLYSPEHYHLGNYAEIVHVEDGVTSPIAAGYDY